jgi:D-glycero-alpha-D-manno-heptose 1-phosphate guanylyltransferase
MRPESPAAGFPVAVLAGGAGTRLRPVVSDRPKVLVPVHGRPFLFILLDQLIAAGAGRIILCTGHLGDQIRETVGDGYCGCPISYSHETQPLGTGGAVRQAMNRCEDTQWMVVNGDSYLAAPLAGFLSWYGEQERNGALLLARVADSARFGTVETGENGRIVAFREKQGLPVPAWINAGIYIVPRSRIEQLPENVFISLERDVFPRWVQEGLSAYCVDAPFIDIGTPESLALAADFFGSAAANRPRSCGSLNNG